MGKLQARAGAGVRRTTQLPGCDPSYGSEVKIKRMRGKKDVCSGKKGQRAAG